jgi:hypothetical protein
VEPSSSFAPAPFTRDYFDHPPEWFRNLVAVMATVLALAGAYGAMFLSLGTETSINVTPVAQSLNDTATPTTAAPTAAPAKFFAADSNVRVTFPSEPKRSTQEISKPPVSLELIIYSVDRDDDAYLVSTFPLAAGIPFDLEAAAKGSAAQTGGRIDSKLNTSFQGFPAMEIIMSVDGAVMQQLIVRAPDRVVQLGFVSGAKDARAYDAFRDSLEIL